MRRAEVADDPRRGFPVALGRLPEEMVQSNMTAAQPDASCHCVLSDPLSRFSHPPLPHATLRRVTGPGENRHGDDRDPCR